MNGWYTPGYVGDMFTQWGSFNIQANMAWSDAMTRPMLGQTPIYNFNNFSQYPDMTGNFHYTNPFFTLGQMSWQNMANGGMPYFNAQGQFQAPWANGAVMNNNWWGSMGWTPSGTTSSNSNLSEEENDYKIKYDTLLPLVKELSKYDEISYKEQVKLKNAISPTGKTWKEKFEALEKAYKNIDKETRKQFILENGYKIGTTKDINGKEDADSFYNRLLDCGYEFENGNSGADNDISAIKDSIDSLSNNNGNATVADNKITTLDTLDVISSWNSKYKDATDSDQKRIITYIEKKYKGIKDESLRDTALDTTVRPLVDGLIRQADDIKRNSSLDKKSKDAIETAISNLTDSLSKCTKEKKNLDSNLAAYFDTLYLLTRQATIAKLRSDVVGYYGEVDPEVFTDDMFATETYEDLKAEGFDDSAIKGAGVTPKKTPAKSGSKKSDAIDNMTALEQVEQLKKDGVIETMQLKTADGKTVYREKEITGDRDYKRLYYIDDNNKLVEWTNTRYDEATNSYKPIDTSVKQEAATATPSVMKADSDSANTARENAEQITESKVSAKAGGASVAKNLKGRGTKSYYITEINTNLNNIDKNNVVEFMDGFYSERSWYNPEGLIEFLDDKNCDNRISMSSKKKLIKSLLERAEAVGLNKDNNEHYAIIKELMTIDYDSDPSKEDFNNGKWDRLKRSTCSVIKEAGFWRTLGTIVSIGCDGISDSEVLDRHMKKLCKDIKEIENKKA